MSEAIAGTRIVLEVVPRREAEEKRAGQDKKALHFELLPNRISCGSAYFQMYRSKIPGGWIVVLKPHDSVTFVPDPQHEWDGGSLP